MDIDPELRSKETWLISEDGLWDICIGLVLLGWGLTMTLRHPLWFTSSIMLAYFLVIMAGKEVITRPRMIYFSIADESLINLSRSIKISFVLIVSGIVFGAVTFWMFDFEALIISIPIPSENLFLIVLSVFMVVLGYLSRDGNRYYYLSGISVLAFVFLTLINISNPILVYSAAILFFGIGIAHLIKFINKFPKSQPHGNVQI